MRLPLAAFLLAAAPAAAWAALPDAGFSELGSGGAALLRLAPPIGPARGPAGPGKDHAMHGGARTEGDVPESLPPDFAPPDATPYPVRGLDVSHYQGDIDWEKLGAAGLSFVFVKATEGGDFVDDHFAPYWSAATRAGLAKGAYHFYNFCRDGASQAANFVKTVPVEAGTLPPVVDLEQSNDCSAWPAKEKFRRELADFAAEVRRVWGQEPIMYVNGSIYERYFQGDDVPYRFWVADISHKTASLPDGKAWAFWQYDWHGSVPGVSGEVDLDVFAGSAQQLASLGRTGTLVASLER